MSSAEKIKRRCVFCGGGPMTAEHVWPVWLLELMEKRLTTTEVVVTRDGSQMTRPSLETTVKQVCESCNTGWMSRLEDAAKPILTPMIMGDGLPLTRTRDEMRILAHWILKTYLMCNFYFPPHERFIPRRLYSEFFRRQTPPQECAIWVAAYRGEMPNFSVRAGKAFDTIPTTYTSEGIVITGRAGPIGVMCSFAMYRFVFQIVLMDIRGRISGINSAAGTQLIWPLPRDSIQWPIRMEAFDDAEFDAFARRRIDTIIVLPR